MKFFRIDLLTLLISLFILASCKNPDSIGLPIDSSQSLQTTLIDTSTILTKTVYEDTIVTTAITKAPLGYFKDPIFGTSESGIAAALNLPSSEAYTIPTGSISIDSAVLVMKYADGFYGDSLTTSYKVNVYQLSETIGSKSYSNRKSWSTESTILGSATFYPRPKTGYKITDIVTGAADTLIKVVPQLRIKLDKNFFTTKFFNASASQLASNSLFQNAIKGFYISVDKTRPGVGGTMFFKMSSDSCNVQVYYKSLATTGTIDTAVIALPVGTPHAAYINYDPTTGVSDLKTQLADTKANSSYSTLYIQGLAGLRAKISFPYLKNILTTQAAKNDVVLNRAELVVTPVAGTYVPFVPTPRLTMYRLDQALQRQLIPDAYAGDLHYIAVGSFGGFYDRQHTSYHYVITGLIEDLMRGKLVDYGTYIAPADTTGLSTGTATISIGATSSVAARAVLGGNSSSAYKMKLNIIYNKVTK